MAAMKIRKFTNDAERIQHLTDVLAGASYGLALWAKNNNADLSALRAKLIATNPFSDTDEGKRIIELIQQGKLDSVLAGILGYC